MEGAEETEAEDPKFHCAENEWLEIITHTMERHYEHSITLKIDSHVDDECFELESNEHRRLTYWKIGKRR